MLPTRAARDVHALVVGGVVAGIAAIDRAAGALARRQARGQASTLGSRGRHATLEGGEAIRLQRIQGPTARVSMQLLGVNPIGRQESSARVILEHPRHQVEWLVHTAEAGEDHRVDGMAGGDEAQLRVLLRRLVHDVADATCVTHACDEAQMIQDWAAVAVWSIHEALLCG